MNWCYGYPVEEACGKWVCRCGCLALYHIRLERCNTASEQLDEETGLNEIIIPCLCSKFQFLNNDHCDIECQMKYLLEKNK